MLITVNAERREVPEGTTVQGLLAVLKIQPQRVAVELNEEIVRKNTYAETVLREGDSLEVVSFMQGGGI
jgi:sulfur carrier protein